MNLFAKIFRKAQSYIVRIVNFTYEQYMRKNLKNKDFTILSSNCIAGVIYNRLGQQFCSPTINLWMRQRDLIELARNLKHYQNIPLTFVESKYDYPVAMLENITIYFNHSKTKETARADWERRMKRVNFENLYIIIYDREDITEEDILALDSISCRGKMVISEKTYPHIPYVKTIRQGKLLLGTHFNQRTWFGLRAYEVYIDFVKWLNQ